MRKKISQMKREEVIDQLRYHAHPTWFNRLLSWNTESLRRLLAVYTSKRMN